MVKILLVDDDPTIQKTTTNLAKLANVEIEVCGTGEDGLEACKKSGDSFDFILMDNYLPNMDGIQTTSQIRSLPNGGGFKIILYSGNDYDDDFISSNKFDGFQKKPMSKKAFEEWMTKLKK